MDRGQVDSPIPALARELLSFPTGDRRMVTRESHPTQLIKANSKS